MNGPIRIEMFGGLRVISGDRAITRFRAQKNRVLLAYLAYHLRQNHPLEVLIEILWPECEPEAGRNRLSMGLSSRRNQFFL